MLSDMKGILFQAAMSRILVVFLFVSTTLDLCKPCFRAGVYEHIQINPKNDQVKDGDVFYYLRKNLDVFKQVTEEAGSEGVQLLLLPEGGLFSPSDRSDAARLAEEIPPLDPSDPLIPCTDSRFTDSRFNDSRFKGTDESPGILRFLSCLARDNHLFLVADLADREPCQDDNCPRDGYRIYNTAVAFDPEGVLVQKYHKRHLFGEYNYDVPESQELSTFDTPFGSVGLFICFDIIYRDPGLSLIRERNVSTLLLPTNWFDEFPFLMASQYHSSFAMGNNVNLLAANMKDRSSRSIGSGIYSGRSGALVYKHDVNGDGFPSLLIANVKTGSNDHCDDNDCDPEPKTITFDFKADKGSYPIQQLPLSHFTYVNVSKTDLNETVCDGSFCCSLDGRVEPDSRLVFGVTNRIRQSSTVTDYSWCEEACVVMAVDTRGQISLTTTAHFKNLAMAASFTTDSVYPSVLGSNLQLLHTTEWHVTSSNLTFELKTHTRKPIAVVGLYGRCYDRDPEYKRNHVN